MMAWIWTVRGVYDCCDLLVLTRAFFVSSLVYYSTPILSYCTSTYKIYPPIIKFTNTQDH